MKKKCFSHFSTSKTSLEEKNCIFSSRQGKALHLDFFLPNFLSQMPLFSRGTAEYGINGGGVIASTLRRLPVLGGSRGGTKQQLGDRRGLGHCLCNAVLGKPSKKP